MPFWRSPTDRREPIIRLEHLGRKWFKLETGFVYKVPYEDVQHAVPDGLLTDLASVPWRLWWLVASYGRHTRASLLHDVLVDDLADRVEADRVFFVALEEGRKRRGGSRTRHWLMWLAVSVFGTMRLYAPGQMKAFVGGLAALWALLIALFAAGCGILFGLDTDYAAFLSRLIVLLFLVGWLVSLHASFIHPRLRVWMWPLAAFWSIPIVPAVVTVELAARAIQIADAVSGGGGPRMVGWRCPVMEPTRLPINRWDD